MRNSFIEKPEGRCSLEGWGSERRIILKLILNGLGSWGLVAGFRWLMMRWRVVTNTLMNFWELFVRNLEWKVAIYILRLPLIQTLWRAVDISPSLRCGIVRIWRHAVEIGSCKEWRKDMTGIQESVLLFWYIWSSENNKAGEGWAGSSHRVVRLILVKVYTKLS